MFRVAIITQSSEHFAENFETREQCDEYILKQKEVKRTRILNKETGKIEDIIDEMMTKGIMRTLFRDIALSIESTTHKSFIIDAGDSVILAISDFGKSKNINNSMNFPRSYRRSLMCLCFRQS